MDIHQSITNQNHVSVTLANHLLSKQSLRPNLVFPSPLSIHVVLSLIAAGSKGQTLDQLLAFLKTNTIDDLNNLSSQLVPWVFVDGSPSGGPCLCFANGAWVDQTLSLKPYFRQVLDSVYNAAANQADEVNEEGTEAAGASATAVAFGSRITNDKVDFVADHPFLVCGIKEDVELEPWAVYGTGC
ncbi:serpin-ZX-like protein [Tanacetum coccineum]